MKRILARLRAIAAGFAWLLAPLQAYDAAHEIDDQETNA